MSKETNDETITWLEMDIAPQDGTEIMGLYGKDESVIRWAESRTCMMAGIAGGYGYFDEGWECVYNNLIVDSPDKWQPID